jgi:hypothetical protein
MRGRYGFHHVRLSFFIQIADENLLRIRLNVRSKIAALELRSMNIKMYCNSWLTLG